MLRLGALAVVAALCAVVVKKNVKELGLVLAVAAGVLILTQVMRELEGIRDLLDSLADTAGISSALLSPVLKTVGIAIVTKLTCEICKDAGEGGLASFVEIAGSVLALWVALPLLKTVLNMITGLL